MARSLEEVQVAVNADEDDDKQALRGEYTEENEEAVGEARENWLSDIRDEVVGYRALADMTDELLRLQAEFLKRRYDALRSAGFSPEEAVRVTAAIGLKIKE